MPHQQDFSRQRILVIGAAGRLGRVLSLHLLDHGASVLGADIRDPEIDHDRFQFAVTDVTDGGAVAELFAGVEERGEAVDAVINAVGTWAGEPLEETSLGDFRRIIDLNLTTTFLCFREAVRHWRRAERGGRLVAIASMQGAEGGVAQQGPYSAAKAGVIRLVEATAYELRDQGIAASAVAPSMILFGEEPKGTAGIPVERVAALCAYLASEAGADHTGTVVRAYGSLLP